MRWHAFVDIGGRRFGNLVVKNRAGTNKSRNMQWNCICDCGNHAVITGRALRSGHTISCGCARVTKLIARSIRHGECKRGKWTPEYQAWRALTQRCNDPNATNYSYYGGRGIRVCERWAKFENFLADVGRKPTPNHSIDRINVDGNYEPSNCRWATKAEQSINTRRSQRRKTA